MKIEKSRVIVQFIICDDSPNPELEERLKMLGDEYTPRKFDHRKLIDLEQITKQLGIEPTETTTKGIISTERKFPAINTVWTLSTLEEESCDVMNQLVQIFEQLKNKVNTLHRLIQEYNISMHFEVIIYVKNGMVPAIYFDTDTLNFINSINATLDIDLYNLS